MRFQKILNRPHIGVSDIYCQLRSVTHNRRFGICKPLLRRPGIGAHQPSRPQKSATEISGNDYNSVNGLRAKERFQYGLSRRPAGFPVVAASCDFPVSSYYKSVTMVSGVIVFLSYGCDKGGSLLFRGYRSRVCKKPGFFFLVFSISRLTDDFIW